MVLRAGRKMVLSALVAESQGPGREGGTDEEEDGSGAQAGPGMSQSELLSVLREGAAAVLANASAAALTDVQLDELLERGPGGRDNFNTAPSSLDSTAAPSVPEDAVVDVCATGASGRAAVMPAEALLGQAPPDIDLRQLEGVVYARTGPGTAVDRERDREAALSLVIEPGAKRARRERVVMIDGAGTGYGRSVPVFADTLPLVALAGAGDGEDTVPRRRRQWTHMSFCCLCGQAHKPVPPPTPRKKGPGKAGKSKGPPPPPEPVSARCAHCPLVFHDSCLAGRAGGKQG